MDINWAYIKRIMLMSKYRHCIYVIYFNERGGLSFYRINKLHNFYKSKFIVAFADNGTLY